MLFFFLLKGLSDPVLLRLDVDTKLSEQLKVVLHPFKNSLSIIFMSNALTLCPLHYQQLAFFSVRTDDKSGSVQLYSILKLNYLLAVFS